MSLGAAPVIPSELQQYNSYTEDPIWQRKFTYIWVGAVGVAVLLSSLHLVRSIISGRAFTGFFGVREDVDGKSYAPMTHVDDTHPPNRRRVAAVFESIAATTMWTLPGVELTLGQILVVAGYLIALIMCITTKAELVDNPNRAGFLALAQFPVVFLFATKNSVLSLLLGPGNGYEKLNYIHRWSGRGMFIGAAVHGALWIRNHLVYDIAILGSQKETSGVAAFGVLCALVLSSLRPIRRYFYQVFFIVHVLGYVAFFITVCYHTIYASPWIFPPLALYGLDILLRMFRYRIKDATLQYVDDRMTLIHVHDCDSGWTAGQHIRLRVFFSGRVFESHPLTIITARPAISCISSHTLILAASVRGDWSRALNIFTKDEQDRLMLGGKEKKDEFVGTPVQVMLDGPYGGCSIDLGQYETVLLVAGGSGATFTLSLLDDIVARCVKMGRSGGEKTRRIEFAWCIRSFACIEWFAPMLMDIASTVEGTSLDLHISVYVTCLCNPEAVPPIPNSDVIVVRPSITNILHTLVTPPSAASVEDKAEQRLNWVGVGGGVGVCAAGPESLTRETQNAVARLGLTRGIGLGGIGLHTELFAM